MNRLMIVALAVLMIMLSGTVAFAEEDTGLQQRLSNFDDADDPDNPSQGDGISVLPHGNSNRNDYAEDDSGPHGGEGYKSPVIPTTGEILLVPFLVIGLPYAVQ
ncbi:MAG: hypothetical protein KOO60_03220 [Gemmatimonadales bacterium]|nr:hypothetical protein [Gemmatimonadales bacterium]